MNRAMSFALWGAVVLVCVSGAQAVVVLETVPVGNPGNPDDTEGDGYGGVDYAYSISKCEVTAGQYLEFLSAVATTDPYGLYHNDMWLNQYGCKIQRAGSSGSYTYSLAPELANRPVNFVTYGDAMRFANWLHNGQPTGAQDLTTTEAGSYYLNGAQNNWELQPILREPDATWVVPSEDEWYKAAYHANDGVTGSYFDYATQSNTIPTGEAPAGTDMVNGSANYDGAVGSTTDVGAYTAKPSDSAYGTFDQSGNLFEWLEAVPAEPFCYVRGGSHFHADHLLHADTRIGTYPVEFSFGVGFRLVNVAVPDPVPAASTWGLSAMTLLVLVAGMIVVARRRAPVA